MKRAHISQKSGLTDERGQVLAIPVYQCDRVKPGLTASIFLDHGERNPSSR
jgi:hypothetical protein